MPDDRKLGRGQHGLGDMPVNEFREAARGVADRVADYLEGLEARSVLPDVKPGEIRARLPRSPPAAPEPLERILEDYATLIEPNVTHWQHPGFMAYFPANGSYPSLLAEFLATMRRVRLIRLRTGAYRWRLYRNADDPRRITEMFLCVSWSEHVAQHRRIDDASAAVLRAARALDADGAPRTRHLVAVDVEDEHEIELLTLEHEEFHRRDGSIPLD